MGIGGAVYPQETLKILENPIFNSAIMQDAHVPSRGPPGIRAKEGMTGRVRIFFGVRVDGADAEKTFVTTWRIVAF